MDTIKKPEPFSNEDLLDILLLKDRVRNDIVRYIKDELIDLLPVDYIIAGGVFQSLYHNEQIKDIDVFILYDQRVVDQVSQRFLMSPNWIVNSLSGDIQYQVDQRSDSYIRAMGNDKLRGVITVSPSAIQGGKSIVMNSKWAGVKIQFIFTRYKTREELISHFDFVHCQMNFHNGVLYVSPLVLECIKNKVLINNITNVQAWRVDKYKAKGYTYKDEPKEASGLIMQRIIGKALSDNYRLAIEAKMR